MRFILGLIVGAVLVVVGAYAHDNMEQGSAKPLVNWSNAAELQQSTFDYVREQFDRVTKWVSSR
jgi:hypothetical protein